MKKNYLKVFTNGLFTVAVLLAVNAANAQVELRVLEGFGSAILDINDSGQAARSSSVYDFTTQTITPVDEEAFGISGINNNGDLVGTMPLERDGETYTQPAYKKNGVWYPVGFFEGADVNASFSIAQISENGNYIAGQMAADGLNAQAFLYNVTTNTLEKLARPENEYGAGYAVNNNGIVGGWYDPLPEGTLRVPAVMTTGSVITPVPTALPTLSGINGVSAINNSNLIVGERDGKPFLYNLTNQEFTEFNIPGDYESASFTSVSENGIAVGYAQVWGASGLEREAIIYHPDLASQPIFIKDLLIGRGIEINTFDGKLGTAIAISPDGKFIGGWENGFFMFASGWIVNFDDELFNSCFIQCPTDVTAVSLSGPKVVNYNMNITCNVNPNATIVLVSGLESGSEFPQGTTEVVHNLVDENGLVLNTCSFTVTINENYCMPTIDTAEAISLVNIAGINNDSDPGSLETYEDFTEIVAEVNAGSSYETICKGNTAGPYLNFFTAFVDWDRNGDFDGVNERYEIGEITESTGNDDLQATGSIDVPADALLGPTTLRIVKNYGETAGSPCNPGSGFGQVEDYTINVNPALSAASFDKNSLKFYPNPVKDILTLFNATAIEKVSVYNMLGQEMLVAKINANSGQVNLSALPTGSYMVKVVSGNASNTIKVLKQ